MGWSTYVRAINDLLYHYSSSFFSGYAAHTSFNDGHRALGWNGLLFMLLLLP